jgi:protein-ribulosamine 3-kinase
MAAKPDARWPRCTACGALNTAGSATTSSAAARSTTSSIGPGPFFFARQRLLPQLATGTATQGQHGKLIADGERLAGKLAALFVDHHPQPSLLHGDLWHGNAATDQTGTLTLFDPAVYFGDREADLAMSELFGGFPDSFYAGYREAWPLSDGFEQRKTLYNLYHVLNHLNLFGSGYLRQAERMVATLLAEIGC